MDSAVPFGRMVEFVCNLPGTEEELVTMLREMQEAGDGALVYGGQDREFVPLDPTWTRVGANLVGRASAKGRPGDLGIYYDHDAQAE